MKEISLGSKPYQLADFEKHKFKSREIEPILYDQSFTLRLSLSWFVGPILFAWAATCISHKAMAQNHTVEVSGLKKAKGTLCLSIFDSDKGFPTDFEDSRLNLRKSVESLENIKFEIDDPELCRQIAVSIYHDENDNGKLDTNFFGVPKEGVGVSNNAKGNMGPPKFKDALYDCSESQIMKIQVIY